MKRALVGIVDYGVGNHASIINMLSSLSCRHKVIRSFRDTDRDFDMIILPGVGAFPPVSKVLRETGLADFILNRAAMGCRVVGICLGMQLLAERSYENGSADGLGLIPGSVVPLNNARCHIGWNRFLLSRDLNCERMREIYNKDFYFNHGYKFEGDEGNIIATTCFEEEKIAAIIGKDNIIGLQFHPEVSQLAGKTLFNRLINLDCDVFARSTTSSRLEYA